MSTDGLITLLEGATEGGRHLDSQIYCWLRGLEYIKPIRDMEGRAVAFRTRQGDVSLTMSYVPRYTTRIEVALQLMPRGWVWDVTSVGLAWCVDDYESDSLERQQSARASTPELAVCIAAIKARNMLGNGELVEK